MDRHTYTASLAVAICEGAISEVVRVQAVAANLNEGVGFDVIARAPQGSWGRFNINIMGV